MDARNREIFTMSGTVHSRAGLEARGPKAPERNAGSPSRARHRCSSAIRTGQSSKDLLSRPTFTTTKRLGLTMDDAWYYRARATLTLRIADQISDRRAAAELKAQAAEYEAKADALDAEASAARTPAQNNATGPNLS